MFWTFFVFRSLQTNSKQLAENCLPLVHIDLVCTPLELILTHFVLFQDILIVLIFLLHFMKNWKRFALN